MTFLILLSFTIADDKPLVPIEPAKFERKEPIEYGKDVVPILTKTAPSAIPARRRRGGYYTDKYESTVKGGKRARR